MMKSLTWWWWWWCWCWWWWWWSSSFIVYSYTHMLMLSAPSRTYLLWIHLTWTTFNHPVWTTSLCIPWPFCSALNWVYFPWLGLFPLTGSISLDWVWLPWLGLFPLTVQINHLYKSETARAQIKQQEPVSWSGLMDRSTCQVARSRAGRARWRKPSTTTIEERMAECKTTGILAVHPQELLRMVFG